MQKYSVIDIETTGGHRNGNKITEIAIINIDGDQVVEEYSTLINPERFIPSNITYLTGITNEMVEHAPKFYEVAKKIIQMTEGRIFVAHNVFFDFNFIKHEFADLGYSYNREKLCTVRLARKYLPGHQSYSLGKICSDLGIEIDNRHRALGDAKATVILFQKILKVIDNKDFINDESKKVVLPPHLERKYYENLPHSPGVYYFYDQRGELLYIGKSNDIKKRVAQHFRPNINRKKDLELKNSVAHIDFKILGNELAALLFECHEIKENSPPFNIALKARRFTYGVKLKETKQGYLYPEVFSSIDHNEFIYIFKNKRSAQKKIDSTLEVLLGELTGFDDPQKKVELMVEKIGVANFNQMIDKVFHQNVPKEDNFLIQLTGPDKNPCLINVKQKKPVAIEIGETERLNLIDDPQMLNILWGYMEKYKLKILRD